MTDLFSSTALGRVEDDEVNAALDAGSIIVTQPQISMDSINTGFNRIEQDDGTTVSAQVLADETQPVHSKADLLESLRAKKELEQEGTPQAYSDAEQALLKELDSPTGIDWSVVDDEYSLPTPAEQGQEYMRKLMGGSLPTDAPKMGIVTIAKDPNSRLSKAINEYAETEGTFSTLAKEEGLSREELFAQKIFPDMEDGMMKSFFQYSAKMGLGEEAFDSIIAIGKGMDYTSAAYTDALEIFFSNMQQQSPAFYDGFMEFAKGTKMKPKSAAESLSRETGNFITFLETLPVAGPIVTGLTTPMTVAGVTRKQAKELARDAKAAKVAAAEAAKKFRPIEEVRAAEKTTRAARRAAAKEVAANNAKIQERMIMEFEQQIGARSLLDINQVIDENKLISESKDGILKLNPEKYREAGQKLLSEQGATTGVSDNFLMEMLKPTTDLTGVKGDIPDFMLDESGSLTVPIIKAENLDAFTAVAADLLERKGVKYDPKSGKRLIDVIFELSVDQEVIPEGELLGLLNKYDLSFEEYATMMVGSASEAGKVLNKFSQISRRVKSKSELNDLKEAQMLDMQNGFFKTFRRVENIRRGLLVSQLATAARNLSSAGVRAPLEGLQNVFDTALYNYSKDGLVAGAKSLGDVKGNWADSFRHMKYIFDPRNYNDVKEYTDYILDRPEFSNQLDRMFNNINEIRKSTGAGEGGIGDKALTLAEKGVDVLNTPNRWQEYLVRRGAFTAELERLVKREYGVELIDIVNEGKLPDLLNDSPEFVTEGKASFKTLTSEAVDKALDITYAKQPEVAVFREMTSFITRNGLTTVAPFPRFMFNSMELAAEYGGGAFAPAINRAYNAVRLKTNFGPVTPDELKKLRGVKDSLNVDELALVNKKAEDLTDADKRSLKKLYNRVAAEAGGPLTKAERRMMSRNLVGVTVILPAAMMYRNSEDAPADYKFLRTDEGTLLDTSAQSPILRQALWVAEYGKRLQDGTLNKWMREQGYKEGAEAFIGTNIRTGTGGVVFQDISDMFSQADALGGEKAGKFFGEAFGEYFSTYLTPINQVIETQRAFEFRPNEYLDLRSEPTFEESPFTRGFITPFRRKGYTTLFTPSEEKGKPLRETLFQEGDAEERVTPLAKVFTGLSMKKDVSETGKFLNDLGFADYKIRPRTISPGFQRYETKVLRNILPSIVDAAQNDDFLNFHKERARMRPQSSRDEVSDSAYVRLQQIAFIQDQIGVYKREIDGVITKANTSGKPTDVVRSDLTDADGNPVDVELTAYLAAQQKFRRMKPDERDAAFVALPSILREMGLDEEPSLANIKHLNIMMEYAKTARLR